MQAGLTSIETLGLRVGESHALGHTAVSKPSTRTGAFLEWSIPTPLAFGQSLYTSTGGNTERVKLQEHQGTHCEFVGPRPAWKGQSASQLRNWRVLPPATAPHLAEALQSTVSIFSLGPKLHGDLTRQGPIVSVLTSIP